MSTEWVADRTALEVLQRLNLIKAGDEVRLSRTETRFIVAQTHSEVYGTPCQDSMPYRLRLPGTLTSSWAYVHAYGPIVAWRRPT
jgi:hypothetical protein